MYLFRNLAKIVGFDDFKDLNFAKTECMAPPLFEEEGKMMEIFRQFRRKSMADLEYTMER